MGNNKITIVINTFKSDDKINHCLDSIDSNFKVIVVENSSNKNFKNHIEKNYPNVKCIDNYRNFIIKHFNFKLLI